MDILSAHRMVVATQDNFTGMARDFQTVKAAADKFVQWINEIIQVQDKETELEMEAALLQKRTRKKKRLVWRWLTMRH